MLHFSSGSWVSWYQINVCDMGTALTIAPKVKNNGLITVVFLHHKGELQKKL